jgi:hypothetical protein
MLTEVQTLKIKGILSNKSKEELIDACITLSDIAEELAKINHMNSYLKS